jgi:hypothetical protein
MGDFQLLRQRMMEEYKQTVERRLVATKYTKRQI